MQKAQTNMVFIFILVAVIMGLMVLFGYMAVTKLSSTSSEVEMTRFVKDIQNDVLSIKRLRGSTQVFDYRVPNGISTVCFVTDHIQSDYVAISAFAGNQSDNLFLLDRNIIVRSAFIDNIETFNATKASVPESCYDGTRIVAVKYEGKGSHTNVFETETK